jgi:transaldolase
MKKLKDLTVKIFADGADKADMLKMNENHFIQGLTTNPTLMKKAGINDYSSFCKEILKQKLISKTNSIRNNRSSKEVREQNQIKVFHLENNY